MKYFVKRIGGGNYSNAELNIKLGEESPVTETQYKYLNRTFGTSGYFTFRTEGTAKAASAKETSATPKDEKTEDKVVTKKATKSKKSTKEK